MSIETKNLTLIACDIELLKSAIEGNHILSERLKVIVPENWTEFGVPGLQYALQKLSESEEEQNWWTYFPIHKTDNKLIGSCGYKGKPSDDGIVEIGYEIASEYRNMGLATELANGLVEHAFKNRNVKAVIAHTLGNQNQSTKVLQKCNFKKVEEIEEPEHGVIWKWEFKKFSINN